MKLQYNVNAITKLRSKYDRNIKEGATKSPGGQKRII